MKVFKLPDLGEGLPDAIIREWHVKEGDKVIVDQPLVSMETAKALVDVPSPVSGKIVRLFGKIGDTIKTDCPLIGFEETFETKNPEFSTKTATNVIKSDHVILKSLDHHVTHKPKRIRSIRATPAIRKLAKQLGVDLSKIKPRNSIITSDLVKKAFQLQQISLQNSNLSNVRQAMAFNMSQSHRDVVPVSLSDDADIHIWESRQDISIRLIRAIEKACITIPIMNAYFDGNKMSYQIKKHINIGIAIDTPNGLYVPVLKDIAHKDDNALRQKINHFKEMAQTQSLRFEDLQGATIMLSNFGMFAGRYANPIVLPPLVTVVGAGRVREQVVPSDNGQPAVHRILPLSITSDHRIITGGEIARFLKELINALEKKKSNL
ncbi:dihydrolipoamide acetyltransferase family protein [Coxiella endosymbiont of Amblyomma americanum]|uniref:dihydrolipoamide acetyltransferase family protein n=1 Tax=Coxiella endosymbiont of Amblyomma americanum TaxID=325775 RepID=UPI00057EB63F|nr:dihydrolipoamide acetyltransferase family protein [Coxiella endosymbiont of Amblyomma americanum]AJC50317.1 branched-chain alpha-keto acid dehydrogenase subunit E2 [Coxiella endosymbiont of Amblyomma americanum]AUJ58665.1 branched-chain alpha-keto acid dehydrogenase subunit E2 [Coxiella-like endosymbiont of Amblyomma americanum]